MSLSIRTPLENIIKSRDVDGLRMHLRGTSLTHKESVLHEVLSLSLSEDVCSPSTSTKGLLLTIIDSGAPIELVCDGMTAIMHCACWGWVDAIDRLIAHGAKVGLVNVGGGNAPCYRSPLLLAALMGQIPSMERLHAAGSPLESDDDATRPLLWAVRGYQSNAVKWLQQNGADMVRLRINKDNLLHTCVKFSHSPAAGALQERASELACWLVEQGVNPYCANDLGDTPLALAMDHCPRLAKTMRDAARAHRPRARSLFEAGPAESNHEKSTPTGNRKLAER